MIKGVESILVFSENAARLAEFYNEKVGLKLSFEEVVGEKKAQGEMYGFSMPKGSQLVIIDHSKVKGKNRQPERFIFNLEVDDIKGEVKRLIKNKVKKIQDIYEVEGYGWIATFEDIDGNYFQLVEIKSNKQK